ncbi:hypothetical protein [Umezawaea beigongshangensis]|uniref:hypothetical protein n=1 Tax=Umezawaea beigongshangensis TaxID=2780383 RepID=UPI0018F1E255|nr:hypothetical protein [Umezawaea beigongshangensis]
MSQRWIRGPLGIDAATRVTRTGTSTVLLMVPTTTAGTRLMDLVPLLECDHRVQTVVTVPQTGESWHGTDEFARRTGAVVLPWEQAVQHEFDLVLSASHREIHRVRGPLLLLPHGVGHLKSREYSRKAGGATVPTSGLERELLTHRGRVIPSAVALARDEETTVLAERCPEAAHTGVVAGDVCFDRMRASLPLREHYRRALGAADGRRVVVISSTWAPWSTFGRHPELYRRLVAEAAAEDAVVVAVLHPTVWAVHGEWQVRAWLADCTRSGLLLIPPHEGWRGAVVAADAVVGDHGSTTVYAAALGRPVHLATIPDGEIRRGSVAWHLGRTCPRLDHDRPLLPQLDRPSDGTGLRGLVTSRPDRAGTILRGTMYRLLGLSEPPHGAPASPVPLPVPLADVR